MLGYTNAGNNGQLASEIWNDTKKVEYQNIDGEYGHFNASEDANKVILSDVLLGKGKEASAMLATVMSHEGTHVYGNRIEGVAHLAGLQTYSQLGEMFKLKGNKDFTESMEKAFYDEKSWKENTGDVDYWKLSVENGRINISWDGSQNLTLPDGTVLEVENDTGKISAGKLTKLLFGNYSKQDKIEKLFNDSDKKLKWNGDNWVDQNSNVISIEDNFKIDITDLINLSSKFSKGFDKWLAYGDDGSSGMLGVQLNDIGQLPEGLFGYVNRTRLLADEAAMTSVLEGTTLEKITT